MTSKQRDAIEAHGLNLLKLFPDATERDPVALCKKLRRWEKRGDRRSLRMCNEAAYSYAEAESDKRRILGAVHKLLGSDRVWLNGDPRGYALKIDLRDGEELHRDWGGYGIIAPEIGSDGH